MPEMSVVRFTESDVICASTLAKTMRLIAFADGEMNNAKVEIDGNPYSRTGSPSFDDAYAHFYNLSGSTMFYWDTSTGHGYGSFNTIMGYDNSTDADGGSVDTTYTWNPNGSSGAGFYHQ